MRFVTSMSIGLASAISPMSAPAAKARSLPVTTIARTSSSRSSCSRASQSASITAPFSALQLLRPVDADEGRSLVGLALDEDQGLVCHVGLPALSANIANVR